MVKIKTYTTPTNLLIVGTSAFKKEHEDVCIHMTDDYCSGSVQGNKNTDEWIETDGSMTIIKFDNLETALNDPEYPDSLYDLENIECVQISDFVGDVYVRLVDDDKKDHLKADFDIKEYTTHQENEDEADEDDREWLETILLFSGDYSRSIKSDLSEYAHLIKEDSE